MTTNPDQSLQQTTQKAMNRHVATAILRCNLHEDLLPPEGWVLVSADGLRRVLNQFPEPDSDE